MRAIVTGGAGFIGSHLVDALISSEATVLVLDDLSKGKEANLHDALNAGAELSCLDIRDGLALERAFLQFRPNVVFHLAAQMDVRVSMAEPARDAQINVVGSINVFSASAACEVRRVVNTSTGGAIYGDIVTIPTPENAPTLPLSAYGLSKRTAEHYADWFRRMRGLDIITLRYGNVYGPRQDPYGDPGVVAIISARLLAGLRPHVYGNGQQTRDYVFVRDIVEANLAAASAQGLPNSIYHVGTGREVSVLDLVSAIVAAGDADPESFKPEMRPAREGEVQRNCLDVTRARNELHLGHPTSLEDGLKATLDWLRKLPHLDPEEHRSARQHARI
jgi:UDP-glucose 4-epimerase